MEKKLIEGGCRWAHTCSCRKQCSPPPDDVVDDEWLLRPDSAHPICGKKATAPPRALSLLSLYHHPPTIQSVSERRQGSTTVTVRFPKIALFTSPLTRQFFNLNFLSRNFCDWIFSNQPREKVFKKKKL